MNFFEEKLFFVLLYRVCHQEMILKKYRAEARYVKQTWIG
jgi:hypothetical protein